LTFQHDIDKAVRDNLWSFLIGQHVWLKGSSDEFVVMDADRETGQLQLLPVDRIGHFEAVPVTRLRAVLPPRSAPADAAGESTRTAA
jgi:hypothetical protein